MEMVAFNMDGALHGMAWHWIDMVSHLEDRYVLDPSTGRRGTPECSDKRSILTRSTIEPLVARRVATITLRVRDFEQSSFTLS